MKRRLLIMMLCLLHTISQCSSPLEYAVNNLPADDKVTLYHFIKNFQEKNQEEGKKLNAMWQYVNQAYADWSRVHYFYNAHNFLSKSQPWHTELQNELSSDSGIITGHEKRRRQESLNASFSDLKKIHEQMNDRGKSMQSMDILRIQENQKEADIFSQQIKYEQFLLDAIKDKVAPTHKTQLQGEVESLNEELIKISQKKEVLDNQMLIDSLVILGDSSFKNAEKSLQTMQKWSKDSQDEDWQKEFNSIISEAENNVSKIKIYTNEKLLDIKKYFIAHQGILDEDNKQTIDDLTEHLSNVTKAVVDAQKRIKKLGADLIDIMLNEQ